MHRRHVVLVALMSATTLVVTAAPAASETRGSGTSGSAPLVARDVSFPQCGSALPRATSAVAGVLGANNGTAFSRNPCLVSELRWAKRLAAAPAFYANTGNPGPSYSTHWPLGQTTPKLCSAADRNSLGCSYDYGWNAGRQAFSTATDAAQRLHHVGRADARQRVANVDWWLDVETMNSWQSSEGSTSRAGYRRDVATVTGEMAALRDLGVAEVGIYSTPYQWNVITGGSKITRGRFADVPQWLAGYESNAGAAAGCAHGGFTDGPVRLVQYLGRDGFDADVVCGRPDPD